HREHALAQRAATAHGRSQRGARAADGDFRGAARHLKLTRRARAGVPSHAGKCDPDLRGQIWPSVADRGWRRPDYLEARHTSGAGGVPTAWAPPAPSEASWSANHD